MRDDEDDDDDGSTWVVIVVIVAAPVPGRTLAAIGGEKGDC